MIKKVFCVKISVENILKVLEYLYRKITLNYKLYIILNNM